MKRKAKSEEELPKRETNEEDRKGSGETQRTHLGAVFIGIPTIAFKVKFFKVGFATIL